MGLGHVPGDGEAEARTPGIGGVNERLEQLLVGMLGMPGPSSVISTRTRWSSSRGLMTILLAPAAAALDARLANTR